MQTGIIFITIIRTNKLHTIISHQKVAIVKLPNVPGKSKAESYGIQLLKKICC